MPALRRWLPFSKRRNQQPANRRPRRLTFESAEARCLMAADGFAGNQGDGDPTTNDNEPKPVLIVIANGDFYHREYFETHETLEKTGLKAITTTAATTTTMPFASGSIGDPITVADDVIVDGNIITAENYDSPYVLKRIQTQELIAKASEETSDPATKDQALRELLE